MAGDDIVIRISGDIKGYNEALKEASEKTADLSDKLASAAKISGVAFAALTAEIGLSVSAYAESEQAVNELNQSLINQGIYSKDLSDKYQKMATELQNVTGISDEAIIASQSTIQAFLGELEVTPQLTKAIADLSVAKGIDLSSAAKVMGMAIDGNVGMLKRYGIEVDENASKTERMRQVIEGVTGKYNDFATVAGEGVIGSLNILKQTFSTLQEEIGARFAPIITAAAQGLSKFMVFLSNNKPLIDFIASLTIAGVVVTGAIATISSLAIGFLALKSALAAAGIATSAMTLGVRALMGATGLGLLVLLIAEIALNWNSVWPRMQASFEAFTKNIGNLGMGLASILRGIFTLDVEEIKRGLNQVKSAFTTGYSDYERISKEKLDAIDAEETNAEKKKEERSRKAADQRAANATREKDDEEVKFADLETLKEEQHQTDLANRSARYAELLEQNAEFNALDDEQKTAFYDKIKTQDIEQTETEKTSRIAVAQQRQADQIKANNQFLVDQQKFGTAYAGINQAMHSEIYKGTRSAFGEMEQMTQSHNATLKQIGKVAAVANIIMKGAESMMNVYAGFSTIPIIGPALGIAAAAAVALFTAERVSTVTAAQDGGLLTGGMRGVDSIPVLAQHGELVSPTSSFEEVIGSVRAAREAQKLQDRLGEPGFENVGVTGGQSSVLIGFDGREASQVLTVRQIEDEALGISQKTST